MCFLLLNARRLLEKEIRGQGAGVKVGVKLVMGLSGYLMVSDAYTGALLRLNCTSSFR